MGVKGYAAALAAAVAVCGPVPPANAYAGLGCDLDAVTDPVLTGQSAFGTMDGGPVTEPGLVTIRCYVLVNGTEVAGTPTGSGAGTAATTGTVAFAADVADVVQACAEVTATSGTGTHCTPPVVPFTVGASTFWQAPQPVI